MKITHIKVQNYRSLKEVEIDVDDYTALIGANGSGKSCILYALDWFFRGYSLTSSDIHGCNSETVAAEGSEDDYTVSVTVTFGGLTDQDRARLKQYGRGDTARFRRSWTLGAEKDKVVGNATQGPGFADIRQMTRVTDIRPAYTDLRSTLTDLPDLGRSPSKDDVFAALATWESDDTHAGQLLSVSDDDANHMFGYNGPNIIKDCVRLILIPAAADIASEVGSPGKGSALNELIGSLMSKATATARADWLLQHADKIEELNRLVREGIEGSTGMQAGRINTRLAQLVPNATLAFTPTVPDWTPSNNATVATDVTIDGVTNDVTRQGHGVQRAVMIAMFQSLVPDEDFMTGSHAQQEDETPEEAAVRLQGEIENLPVVIVCIEEPEIYQHPLRARAFARILTELAGQPLAQVLVATHSPYFVRPSQFKSLRRFRLDGGETKSKSTDVAAVVTAAFSTSAKVERMVEKQLPTTFSEGFFCDAVVVVEGVTDKAVIEALAEKMDLSLDTKGISVLEMSGKGELRIPYAIFQELEVPAYTLVDGDALGAARSHPTDLTKQANAHVSHETATNSVLAWLPASTAEHGTLPYAFGDNTIVTKHYTVWEDDIEEELSKWPSFVSALTTNGSQPRSKDLLAYRTAVIDADIADLPEVLRKCVEAIANFQS